MMSEPIEFAPVVSLPSGNAKNKLENAREIPEKFMGNLGNFGKFPIRARLVVGWSARRPARPCRALTFQKLYGTYGSFKVDIPEIMWILRSI